MRRTLGVMCLGLLVGNLSPLVASAAPTLAFRADLRSALMQSVFGESTDVDDALAAAYGDRSSESILRDHVLRVAIRPVDPSADQAALRTPYDAMPLAVATAPVGRYAPWPTDQSSNASTIEQPTSAPLIATYLPPVSQPRIESSPSVLEPQIAIAPGSAYFGAGLTLTPVLSPAAGFNANEGGPSANDAFTTNQISAVSLPVSMRLGRVRVRTRFEGAQAQAPELSLNDQSSGLGANFDVRAGRRRVNVDVDSSFEHLTRNDETAFATSNFDGTSTLQMPQGNQLPVLVPAFADVSKRTVTTGVAVPVARRLTFGVQYDAQRLQGGYGAPGLANLDAQSNTYGANLTLALSHTSSAITLSAKQYRYQDNLVPSNTFSAAQADLNFNVKF